MRRRAASGRASAAGRVCGRTLPTLKREMGCRDGQGSPRAADARARAQGEKRTLGVDPGVRLVLRVVDLDHGCPCRRDLGGLAHEVVEEAYRASASPPAGGMKVRGEKGRGGASGEG